jgi:hypothetical protein
MKLFPCWTQCGQPRYSAAQPGEAPDGLQNQIERGLVISIMQWPAAAFFNSSSGTERTGVANANAPTSPAGEPAGIARAGHLGHEFLPRRAEGAMTSHLPRERAVGMAEVGELVLAA